MQFQHESCFKLGPQQLLKQDLDSLRMHLTFFFFFFFTPFSLGIFVAPLASAVRLFLGTPSSLFLIGRKAE